MTIFFASPAHAAVTAGTLLADTNIGSVTSIAGLFVWMFNLLRFIGWAGVIVGIGWVIVLLIYKLFNTESEEAAKTVQQGITHAVIIIIAFELLMIPSVNTNLSISSGLYLFFEINSKFFSSL